MRRGSVEGCDTAIGAAHAVVTSHHRGATPFTARGVFAPVADIEDDHRVGSGLRTHLGGKAAPPASSIRGVGDQAHGLHQDLDAL